jgi:hypothetical protein
MLPGYGSLYGCNKFKSMSGAAWVQQYMYTKFSSSTNFSVTNSRPHYRVRLYIQLYVRYSSTKFSTIS